MSREQEIRRRYEEAPTGTYPDGFSSADASWLLDELEQARKERDDKLADAIKMAAWGNAEVARLRAELEQARKDAEERSKQLGELVRSATAREAALAQARRSWDEASHDAAQYEAALAAAREALERIADYETQTVSIAEEALARIQKLVGGGGDPA